MHIIMWVLYFILGTSIEKDKNLAILLAIVRLRSVIKGKDIEKCKYCILTQSHPFFLFHYEEVCICTCRDFKYIGYLPVM